MQPCRFHSIMRGMQDQEENREEKTEEKTEDFSFMKEKIKEKPLNKRKIVSRVLLTLLCAVIFGVVASLVIAFLLPRLQKRITPEEEPEMIVIPRDERIPEPESETESETETETETEESTEEPSTEEMLNTEPVEVADLLPEQQQNLRKQLYAIGEEANRFIVTVTGVKSDTDWFNAVYSSEDKASGAIVANTGDEILIVTENNVIRGAESVLVTFINGETADATLKGADSVTGMAVLTIPVQALKEETLQEIKTATLANSLNISKGTTVLALGSPLGTNYSILTGAITGTGDSIFLEDAVFTVFQTDIITANSGNGVLADLNGEVIGFMRKENASVGTISAISVSELKSLLEKLENGLEVPYLGLYISTVTKSIADEYDLPQGVFINSVEMDSPGMEANLLSGDVIVEMDGTKVTDAEAYRTALFEHAPGDTIRIVVERLGSEGYTKVSCTATVGICE